MSSSLRRQRMDVFAVERRDKGPIERLDDFFDLYVADFLVFFDFAAALGQIVVNRDHVEKLDSGARESWRQHPRTYRKNAFRAG